MKLFSFSFSEEVEVEVEVVEVEVVEEVDAKIEQISKKFFLMLQNSITICK